jgi:pumilio RNA-binding family
MVTFFDVSYSVNKSLKGKWAALACHETGSLVVQHAFENLEESAKDDIIDELLNRGPVIFAEVTKSQWGSYCIQHSRSLPPFLLIVADQGGAVVLEHGSQKHRQMTLDHLTAGLLEYATNEQGAKSVNKALKEGGKEVVDRFVRRMAECIKGYVRHLILSSAD